MWYSGWYSAIIRVKGGRQHNAEPLVPCRHQSSSREWHRRHLAHCYSHLRCPQNCTQLQMTCRQSRRPLCCCIPTCRLPEHKRKHFCWVSTSTKGAGSTLCGMSQRLQQGDRRVKIWDTLTTRGRFTSFPSLSLPIVTYGMEAAAVVKDATTRVNFVMGF